MRITVLGCGTSGGVPRIGNHWGACDPANPKNRRRRVSIAVEQGATRLIVDTHDAKAFAPIAAMTVGELRDHLLAHETDSAVLQLLARGITPEIAAAVSKLMRNQDLVLAARKCRVVTAFRNTIGLPGTMSVRLQPNHPTEDVEGIMASIADGLMYGAGDAVIGINPASDSTSRVRELVSMLDELIARLFRSLL